MLGEVHLRWSGVGLTGCELAKGTVRPARFCMRRVLGRHLAPVVLVDDQQPVEDLPAQVTMILSQIAFVLGARGGPSGIGFFAGRQVSGPNRALTVKVAVGQTQPARSLWMDFVLQTGGQYLFASGNGSAQIPGG